MGDFNGRVGERRTPWTKHLGPHSDHRTPCNYSGNHVLELCAEHDLIVTNTFFQRRATQIYTWYKWSDIDVSSQIDFTLARSRMRSNIRDSKAIPNAGLCGLVSFVVWTCCHTCVHYCHLQKFLYEYCVPISSLFSVLHAMHPRLHR
ncbi:hypothetical protein ACOMHN_000695 [Nucella lapillus]